MDLGQTPQFNFLWTTDWGNSAVWQPGLLLFLLPLVSGALAFLTSRISMKMNAQPDNPQANSMKSMMLLMPLINVYFAFIMPGAIGVYIIASMLFQAIQEIVLTKHYTKVMAAEDAVKFELQRKREEELEAKRLETEQRKLENNTYQNPNTSKKKKVKTERQEQIEKAVEWEKKNAPPSDSAEKKDAASCVGTRRYARGRAFDPERFDCGDEEQPEDSAADESAEEDVSETVNPESSDGADEADDMDGEEDETDKKDD